MYGTVARVSVKPGSIPKLQEITAEASADQRLGQGGHIATYMYQSDREPNELLMVVIFTDREAYHNNANSPGQNAQYEKMAKYFAAPPEWNDGEIVWSYDRRLK